MQPTATAQSYLVPDRDRAVVPGGAGLRHVLPPAQGPHRHARPEINDASASLLMRPAAAPGGGGPRQGRLPLHQQPRGARSPRPSPSTTPCRSSGPTSRRSAWGWRRRAAPCCSAAGAAGKRFALPNSRVLIHQPHGGAQGQSIDIENQAREIAFLRGRMEELLALHTGQPIERIARDTDRDYILGADDAVAYGLVDEVLAGPAGPSPPRPLCH